MNAHVDLYFVDAFYVPRVWSKSKYYTDDEQFHNKCFLSPEHVGEITCLNKHIKAPETKS